MITILKTVIERLLRGPKKHAAHGMGPGGNPKLIGRYRTRHEAVAAAAEWLAENAGGATSQEYAERSGGTAASWTSILARPS